jgi:uncharacterized protein
VTEPYRYRPALFFALAYAASWVSWLGAIAAASRPAFAPYAQLLNLAGVLGARLGQYLSQARFQGPAARSSYALLAVFLPFAVIYFSVLLSLWLGESGDQFGLAGGGGFVSLVVLALILAPICEEVGWHGYGVDSLRAGAGMMKATLLFALLWCAWHAPLVVIPGTYQHQLATMENKIFIANFFVSIFPVAIIANWFYYKNERSIALAVLVHSMLNAASVLINAGQVAKVIATVLYAAIAAALVFGDRRLFAQGPRNFLQA